MNEVYLGDCRDSMRFLIADGVRVQMCVTSPPYYGLRDYGVDGQLGLEKTPAEYVANMVEVFRHVRDVLADDGTVWLNIGDAYNAATTKGRRTSESAGNHGYWTNAAIDRRINVIGLKPKDMLLMPERLAIALQEDGWWVRSRIIWCLSGGAWVYARTQKGDMPVMVKDLVRLDPATVRLWNGEKWTRVLGWGPSNDESERIELVLRSGERIGCTGGHQWPTQRGNVVARELQVGDTIRTCRLPEPDGCARPNYLTNDALWLIGLYLAEGSRNGNARQLSLSADEQHWIPRIRAVAEHFGGSCAHTVDGGSLCVRLYGAVLHAVIDAYIGGSVAVDKHLKVAAWRLPNEALSAMVQGYLDGDGHDDAGNDRWRLGFCRNYSLERDLRTLAARLGATLTLKPVVAKYQGGELPAFRGEWRWGRGGHWNEKDRGEVVEIRASRARGFWDIAVEDEPHLFALASGVLTHNCKPNPMPESVRDRPTKSHEHIWLLSKAERYYYDADAIKEPASPDTHARYARGRSDDHKHTADIPGQKPQTIARSFEHMRADGQIRKPVAGWATGGGDHSAVGHARAKDDGDARKMLRDRKVAENAYPGNGVGWGHGTDAVARNRGRVKNNASFDAAMAVMPAYRNRRSVWTVATQPFSGAHFATFPPALVEPCILAGSRPGDVVFDPFMGSGTVAQVAQRLGRNWLGCELNPAYLALQAQRTRDTIGMAL